MGATIYLLPHQERSIQSPECFPHIRWHFLLGGYGCVHGDSLLETPGGKVKIKDFSGGYVYALDNNGNVVEAKAGTPIRYEKAPLYKLELSNGKSIVCTEGHKVLTPQGWMTVSQLLPGQHYVCVVQHPSFSDNPQESSSDTCLSGSPVSVPCLKKKVQGSLDGYPASVCLSDEQLLQALGTDLTSVPLQDDAHTHSHDCLHMGDQVSGYRYNHSCLQCDHPCRNHSISQKHHHALREECCTLDKVSGHICEKHQESVQSLLNSDQKQLVDLSAPQEQDVLAQSCVSYSYEASLVKSITYLIESDYYDLNVPGYHNYIAEGMVHHNCGKTTCLVFTLLYWTSKLQGVKDDGGKYARIIVGGYTYAHLEQTVMIDLLSYLDQSKTVYRYDTKNHIMYIGTVEIIYSQLSEPDRIFGQSVYCVLCDEIDELPEDVMIEAMKSVSQRCRQKLKGQRTNFIQSFSTAQGYKGFYRLYTQYKKNNISFVLIRALTKDNIYLPKEYIEDLEKSFTETERKVFMEGEFLSVSQGRVIPGFDWDKNFVNKRMDNQLAPGTRVYIGMDFNTGYSRASAWVSMVDNEGRGVLCCIKYYDFPDALEAPNVFRYDFPEQDIFWIPDVTSKDSFPQFARALRQNNIHIIYRTKSPLVEDSCFFISSMCYQGRLLIYDGANNVAEAFAQASRDKSNKIPKGVGESSPIHTIDGARYATSYMALVLPEYRDIRRSLMTHIATYRNLIESGDNEVKDVQSVGAGYTQIEGSAYLR